VNNMKHLLNRCVSITDINPYNFELFSFDTIDNKYIQDKYPELYL